MAGHSQADLHVGAVAGEEDHVNRQVLKDSPVACADGHDPRQAPCVDKIPRILVAILDYIVQRVTGRGCSLNEKVGTRDCVWNYGNQIR